jgi:protein-S-isoprenylcysteine O-methyltransferase Ste14
MLVIIPIPNGLNGKLKKALKNGELSEKEVRAVKGEIDERHRKSMKGLKMGGIIAAVVFVLLMVVTFLQMANSSATAGAMLAMGSITAITIILAFIIAKYLYIDLMRNQFRKAVRKGYPKISFE